MSLSEEAKAELNEGKKQNKNIIPIKVVKFEK
jgi:hypothetical protein